MPDRLPVDENLAQRFVRTFPWVHLTLGLLGNVLFVAGSVSLLLDARLAGTYLFLGGSIGMLIGRVGELFRLELDRRLRMRRWWRNRSRSLLARQLRREALAEPAEAAADGLREQHRPPSRAPTASQTGRDRTGAVTAPASGRR